MARGLRKENRPGLSLRGRLNRMLIPRFINGFVKSMTFSRRKLMVNDATAKSAFYTTLIARGISEITLVEQLFIHS